MLGKLTMNDAYENCMLCARRCGVNRRLNKKGVCGESDELHIARAALHMWEEPCISGEDGSGTVFFSGCSLGCVFCQNYNISANHHGKIITQERLYEIFFELKAQGANNINLVTPTHFAPTVARVIAKAVNSGLDLPIVYNTSSYDSVETLKLFDGLADIYLPDFKYYDASLAKKYSHAADYPNAAKLAVQEMVSQRGRAKFNSDGIMTSGVIVRHLILPGCTEDSKKVIEYLYKTYGDDIYISIMNQYTPTAYLPSNSPLSRKVTAEEYDEVIDYALSLGVENGFVQEGEAASESFIPDFDLTGV